MHPSPLCRHRFVIGTTLPSFFRKDLCNLFFVSQKQSFIPLLSTMSELWRVVWYGGVVVWCVVCGVMRDVCGVVCGVMCVV